MASRQHIRAGGMGSVQQRSRAKMGWWALAPRFKGEEFRVIAKCDTRWAAERALKAWYVVEAVAILAGLKAPCDEQLAS